jgi:hypothetical protein
MYSVVYMPWDAMILMWTTTFRGPLKEVGSENLEFFGPEKATSEASAIWAQKVDLNF